LNFIKQYIKGFLLVFIIVLTSIYFSSFILIGSISIAIILGIIINNFYGLNNSYKKGIDFSEKQLLSVAIITMGSNLNFSVISEIDLKIIFNLVLIILVSIIFCLLIGKLFNLSSHLSLLLGLGNGICGSSAIAGASSVLNSKDEDIALSISTINFLGTISIFLLPTIINSFLNGENAGFLIGSTIQAVGQVTAAGFIMSDEIGEFAVIIKMIRILMLGPVLILLTLFLFKKNKSKKNIFFSIPPFIIGFSVLVLAVNFSFIPLFILETLNTISKYCLLFAMTAIGLNTSLKSMVSKGPKVLLVASISFCFQIIFVLYLLS